MAAPAAIGFRQFRCIPLFPFLQSEDSIVSNRAFRRWPSCRSWFSQCLDRASRHAAAPPDTSEPTPLYTLLADIATRCTECGACVRDCAFLQRHGTPKAIAAGYDCEVLACQERAFACSLCGLCAAVCPEGLDPGALFLALRRRAFAADSSALRPYRRLLAYEALGRSALLAWHGIPPGCDTVFFPGCALPGARPEATMGLYRQLRRLLPSVGIVLDCCIKPSHDLGRTAFFEATFFRLRERLIANNIRTVLTACPNCTKIFRQYGERLAVRTVWEVLQEGGFAPEHGRFERLEVSVHDPCPLRDDEHAQAAVRGLLTDWGCTVVEMNHRGKRTVCCGEGGAVGCIDPDLAGAWTGLRAREADSRLLVASCSGCVAMLNRRTPTAHLVDFLYRPNAVGSGTALAARPPFTYWHRLLLKYRLQREVRCATKPARPSPPWPG